MYWENNISHTGAAQEYPKGHLKLKYRQHLNFEQKHNTFFS